MAHRTNHSQQPRAARGGFLVRLILIIVGIILTFLGLSLGLCILIFTLEEDMEAAMLCAMLPFTLSSLIGGIFIIKTQVSAGRNTRTENTPLAGERPVAAEPETGATSVPTHEENEQPEQSGNNADDDPTEDVAHLVIRSSDLFATLRDLVRHAASSDSDKRHLAGMLEAAGVMAWPDAPACEGGRLSRTTHFWIRTDTDRLTEDQYDILVSTEAALGVNQDLPALRGLPLENDEVQQATISTMRALCEQRIERPQLTEEGLRAAYGTADAAPAGDWAIRSFICNAAECVRTPFRVVYDLRVNSAEGLVVLSPEIPRPRCMAIYTPDRMRQAGIARAYAFRLSVLLASHAFQASEAVTRVVVNCHEHGQEDTLVSLDMRPDIIGLMSEVAQDDAIEIGFPQDELIRASFADGWFVPIEPFVSLDDRRALPAHAAIFPELDQRKASDAVMRTCGARRICDLGINENATRISAWSSIINELGSTTEQAVAALVSARNSTSDITVAEACTRTIQALVDGKLDLDNLGKVAELFVDGSALDVAVERATQLLDDSEGHADPQAAAQILETALAPIDDMGAYLDDEDNVYRYFGSVSERITYNLTVNDGGREVRLVPDAYFNAHSNASLAYGMLGEDEQALAHAEVCRKLAPTSAYAMLRKVRILEGQSRIYEAADLIIAALRHAVTPRDAAICHYRLAFMEWKLGREDLAAACYQRSLTWDTQMSEQAREELEDLLSSNPGLERPTDEQADALLAREGIPLGCVRTDGEHTLAAAVACMDDGTLITARTLMAVLFGMNNDDVVMGIYRSLSVSV